MADNITPINPSSIPTPPLPGNVASLTDPSTLSNLKNSVSPTTFGDQVKNKAKQQVVKAAAQSTIAKLYKEKADLILEGVKLDIDHQIALQQIEVKHTPKKQLQNGQVVDIPAEYDDTKYQIAVTNENTNYKEAQIILQERKNQNQKSIDDYLKDPFKKQKDRLKALKKKKEKRKKKTKEERRKARKEKSKAILQNNKKSLVAILTLTLTNQVVNIIAQNAKIGKLVNDTNNIITAANESGDPNSLQSAQVARDTAIKVIQSNEDKINQINDQIQSISTIINVFGIIVNVLGPTLLGIPTPSPAPDLVTPSKEIFRRKVYEPALRLLNGLSALLPIIETILDKAISILEDYKSQLLDINEHLDNAAAAGLGNAFSLLSGPGGFKNGTGTGFGTVSETYKGFRFALRKEEGPNSKQVRQFKRHYAVAIDSSNVEVLKSDYSFTLDPDDLISQLKLVIDKQKLTTGDGLSSRNGNPNSTNSPNSSNQNNSKLPNQSSVPSISSINSLQKTSSTPPPPIVVVAPGGTTANIPLSPLDKAKIIAVAAASGTNPQPKIDMAFIFAADKKWKDEYKAWQQKLSSGISEVKS
jgi:hypothetical protein